jgi:hypothetical protein
MPSFLIATCGRRSEDGDRYSSPTCLGIVCFHKAERFILASLASSFVYIPSYRCRMLLPVGRLRVDIHAYQTHCPFPESFQHRLAIRFVVPSNLQLCIPAGLLDNNSRHDPAATWEVFKIRYIGFEEHILPHGLATL